MVIKNKHNKMTQVYHEKQSYELCALHALNNLFQAKGTYTRISLDEICISLSPDEWINPHRSILGLGNYDVNVIMKALQLKNYEAIWFDKRKDPTCLNNDNILGYILNVPTDYKVGFIVLPIKRRHWIAIRKINDSYYNLDSKLNSPELIGNEEKLLNYFRIQLQSNDKELFVVVRNDVANSQEWVKS